LVLAAVFLLSFWCVACAQKSAVLACLTMGELKINQRVPNKNANLLKKNQLNGNRDLQ